METIDAYKTEYVYAGIGRASYTDEDKTSPRDPATCSTPVTLRLLPGCSPYVTVLGERCIKASDGLCYTIDEAVLVGLAEEV